MDGVNYYMRTLRGGRRVVFTSPSGCTLNFRNQDYRTVLLDDLVADGPFKAAFLRGEKLEFEMDSRIVGIQLLQAS